MPNRQVRESEVAEPSFQIRPSFERKFRPGAVKDLIHNVLNDTLTGNRIKTESVKCSKCKES